MNDLKYAAKLALEALQECRRDPRLKYEHPTYDAAITALEEALAKQEQRSVSEHTGEPVAWYHAEDFKTHFTTGPSEDLVKSGYWQPLYKKAAL